DVDRGLLEDWLSSQLPVYMHPSLLLSVSSLPLTRNGKIDRKQLSSREVVLTVAETYVAATTATEQVLVNIWEELLAVGRVGIYDNFFSLGGHSIIIIRMLNKTRQEGWDLQLKDFFVYQHIAALAAVVDERRSSELTVADAVGAGGSGHLLKLMTGGDQAPVFIIPGSGGICDGYDELAILFKGISPVYGIQMPGVLAGESPLETISAIAIQHISWIKEVYAAGPYRFIAHSFGAHVAFEMARLLESTGEKVEWVVMLDSSTTLNKVDLTNMERDMPEEERIDFVVRAAGAVFEGHQQIADTHKYWLDDLKSAMRGLDMRGMAAYLSAFVKEKTNDYSESMDFLTRLIQLRVSNVVMTNQVEGCIQSPLIIARALESRWTETDEYLGWAAHASDIRMLEVSGDHLSMTKDPHIAVLLTYLKDTGMVPF
ncbi:thioesterase domain-containing protein, partial [Chitinophaga sp. MD30]|uniref:thioesterase domain-containing protein n=2 Tax=Chitinophaga TaxID=79328 RepID=UPI000BBF616E